jgi:hypothetical protein
MEIAFTDSLLSALNAIVQNTEKQAQSTHSLIGIVMTCLMGMIRLFSYLKAPSSLVAINLQSSRLLKFRLPQEFTING